MNNFKQIDESLTSIYIDIIKQSTSAAFEIVEDLPAVQTNIDELKAQLYEAPDDAVSTITSLIDKDVEEGNLDEAGFLTEQSKTIKYLQNFKSDEVHASDSITIPVSKLAPWALALSLLFTGQHEIGGRTMTLPQHARNIPTAMAEDRAANAEIIDITGQIRLRPSGIEAVDNITITGPRGMRVLPQIHGSNPEELSFSASTEDIAAMQALINRDRSAGAQELFEAFRRAGYLNMPDRRLNILDFRTILERLGLTLGGRLQA